MAKKRIAVVPLWDEEKNSIWMLPNYLDGIRESGGVPLILPLHVQPEDAAQILDMCDDLLMTGGHDISPSVYGEETLMWIIPKELTKAFGTLLDIQNGNYTVDAAVTSAIHSLQKMDTSILTDNSRIEKAFMALIGSEYSLLWDVNRTAIITEAKIKIGNDMSTWTTADLTTLQGILKRMQQEKAKKEKLAGTKSSVRTMQESVLRDRVTAFLDAHPEFCDEFSE